MVMPESYVGRHEALASVYSSAPADASSPSFLGVKVANTNMEGRYRHDERDTVNVYGDKRAIEGDLATQEFFQTAMCGAIDGLNAVEMTVGPHGTTPLHMGNVECRTLDKFRAGYERASQLAGLAGYYDWSDDHRVLRAERGVAPGGNASPVMRMDVGKKDSRTRSAHLKGSTRPSLDAGAPKGTYATSVWGFSTAADRSRPRRVTADMVRERAKQISKIHGSDWAYAYRGETKVRDSPMATVLTREVRDNSAYGPPNIGSHGPGIAKGFGVPG